MSSSIQPHSFHEVGRLIDHIPITSDMPNNGKFMEGASIDSQYPMENDIFAREFGLTKNAISFRDIVRLYIKVLKQGSEHHAAGQALSWREVVHEQRYKQLQELGSTYPVNYLLFDFCLAALDGDLVDARLFLAHAFHILGLNRSLNLLLSVIVNEALTQDGDVRDLLVLFARVTEPRNARNYSDTFGPDFKRRYGLYETELKRLERT